MRDFESNAEVYKPKSYKLKAMVPVSFISNPPEVGEIAPNCVFKFVDNFKKFSKAKNRVSMAILTEF